MDVKQFVKENYKHFNAAVLVDAAEAWIQHLSAKGGSASGGKGGGKMFLAMAGALSTGEIGILLSEMIRNDKIHGICCTGANLEEDIFNLIAHNNYKQLPHYRHLTPQDELELKDNHFNRVADTCIPEEAMRKLGKKLYPFWKKAEEKGKSSQEEANRSPCQRDQISPTN